MGTEASMGVNESWQVVVDQRLAIAEMLAGLSESQWEQPSLCADWTVHDVAAHVTLIPIPPSPGSMVVDFAKARGNLARANTVATRRRAQRTPTQILQDLRSSAESRSVPRPASPANVMWDILVHAQDIAIPLGIDFPTPPTAGAAAATRIWELRWPFSFGPKRRLGAYRLTSSDADWSVGTGPEIAGPISAMLLLLTGRTAAAVPLLTGPGVSGLTTSPP
ncbi:maleylpyruvate isomerase family mycothiol-dependent enzyme [Nocardioides euryhalodurans]|uniref:Maleylpyruvate isomerase family mycothiol-dependent enzyme n=1 Tax=Nocardioides euryhalodurans TaxID=2518370 RepID=A0A4P7GMU7_9ACTN|nr:maleylpyruvate isomerase family mycothiol-dependent enzyme [Nocardioides euryhalodurans]QBR93214.1 maleylpyruvate isomerase family mycothiol-dependent enzyme [Nocardioides euryhalodurans]